MLPLYPRKTLTIRMKREQQLWWGYSLVKSRLYVTTRVCFCVTMVHFILIVQGYCKVWFDSLIYLQICSFLFTLSHKFSSYYGRVHILGVRTKTNGNSLFHSNLALCFCSPLKGDTMQPIQNGYNVLNDFKSFHFCSERLWNLVLEDWVNFISFVSSFSCVLNS